MEKILQLYYSQLSLVSCEIKIYSSTTASQYRRLFCNCIAPAQLFFIERGCLSNKEIGE